MLTERQRDCLIAIEEALDRNGVAPTIRELTATLGFSSKQGTHRLLTLLENRGYIRRLPYKSRAIDILRRHDDPLPMREGIVVRLEEGTEHRIRAYAKEMRISPATAIAELLGEYFQKVDEPAL